MNDQPAKNSRERLRYKPDAAKVTFVEASTTGLDEPFRKELSALALSESHTGCALVVLTDNLLQEQTRCRILMEHGDIRDATVVWRKVLDEHVIKVGIHFESSGI